MSFLEIALAMVLLVAIFKIDLRIESRKLSSEMARLVSAIIRFFSKP